MMSVVSLMLATIMMTSASFAWFTISTAPEVSNVITKMAANNNLEIMLDNGYDATTAVAAARTLDPDTGASANTNALRNNYWGNLVDLDSFFKQAESNGGTMKDLVLKPVIATEDATNKKIDFATPKFALDGRIDGKTDLFSRTADKGVRLYAEGATEADVKKCYAVAIDLWLRTNTDGVKVNLGAKAQRGDSAGEEGLGSWITNDKITVKIVDTDNGTVYTAKHGTIDTDNRYPLTLTTASTGEGGVVTYTDATIDLTQNVAKKITVYVYMDGATLTNADFEKEAKDVMLNLQFVDSASKVTAANALQVTEDNKYGRTTETIPAAYPAPTT